MSALMTTIRDLLSKPEKVVPVVGCGISKATACTPDWRGLVESGIAHLAANQTCSADVLDSIRSEVDKGNLVEAATALKKELGAPGGEYPRWLKNEFDIEGEIKSTEVIYKIWDLLCPLVATTNYDRLLSSIFPDDRQVVTWRSPVAQLHTALLDGGKILHLHGVWDDPESVILGGNDYDSLGQDERSRDIMRSLWIDRTLLFVGCSLAGLEDPDFTALLTWFSKIFRGTPSKHFQLMSGTDISRHRVKEYLHRWRIQIVDYGKHDDLPRFLEQINPHQGRALLLRASLAKEMIKGTGHEIIKVTGDKHTAVSLGWLLQSIPKTKSASNAEYAEIATRLLQHKCGTVAKLRGYLEGMQLLARRIVDPSDLTPEIDRRAVRILVKNTRIARSAWSKRSPATTNIPVMGQIEPELTTRLSMFHLKQLLSILPDGAIWPDMSVKCLASNAKVPT